jgi:hypothetical protein
MYTSKQKGRQMNYEQQEAAQIEQDEKRNLYFDMQSDEVRENYEAVEQALNSLTEKGIYTYMFSVQPPSEYESAWTTWQVNNITKLGEAEEMPEIPKINNHILVISLLKHLFVTVMDKELKESDDTAEIFATFARFYWTYLHLPQERDIILQELLQKVDERRT